MSLDSTTAAIVELAWARRLGLADNAFTAARDGGVDRVTRVLRSAREVTFVHLYGVGVLTGPEWALDAASGLDNETLAQHSAMLDLTRDNGGHGLGVSALCYSDVLLDIGSSEAAAVSLDRRHCLDVEKQCPPDDVNEAGLAGFAEQFALVTDAGTAIAGSGYSVWEGILADLGALVTPELRQQGLGTYIAAVAVEEAMASGLVPQWRARLDHTPSLTTAASLGFERAGTQTTVLLA
jgi:GNAT superfamily N-acetyltransferase